MSASDTVLSIIITCQNQMEALKLTVLALLDQQAQRPCEIIVADCGSTDGTDQFLMTQAKKGSLRALFSGPDVGRTAARNRAAATAEGRLLMFLDPGILVGPGWWHPLMRVLEMDPRVAAASGRILLPNGVLDHAGLSLLRWEATETARPGLGSRTVHAGKPGDHAPAEKTLQVRALPGEALMIQATAFFSVGGFSARVGREHGGPKPDFAGDACGVDLGLRLDQQGWTCVYQPESIMTRLRRPATDFSDHERDMGILGRTWLDRITTDFSIPAQGGVVPLAKDGIKPYVEPMLSFQDGTARGLVHHHGARTQPGATLILDRQDDLAATRSTVESVLVHTQTPHQLFLLDTGTDPGLNLYLKSVVERHEDCQLLLVDDRESRADSINRALAMATGRHIVLLDGGIQTGPGWLDTLVGVAELNPEAGLVGPVTNRMSGLQQMSAVDYDTLTGEGFAAFALRQMLDHASDMLETPRLSGFCLLVKRDLLARIGGLDPRFEGGFYEFNDLSLRARVAGYRCLIARGCFVHQEPAAVDPRAKEEVRTLIEIQWEIFKRKWGIPFSVGLESRFDLNSVLKGGFDPARHFQALGPRPEDTPRARPAMRREVAHS